MDPNFNLAMYAAFGLLALIITAAGKVVYNIFLHPLRRYPGPKTWTGSRLRWAYSMQRGHLHLDVHRLHQIYGTVVRIAPDELSYIDPQAWKDIYLPRPGHTPFSKNPTWNNQAPAVSLGIADIDENIHARSRRALNASFTTKAVEDRAPVLEGYAGLMIKKLREKIAVGSGPSVVNIVEWFDFIAFDILGEFAFSESFGCVQAGKAHPWVSITVGFGKSLGLMAAVNFFSPLDKLLAYTIPKDVLRKAKYHEELTDQKVKQRLGKPESAITNDYVAAITQFYDEKKIAMPPGELQKNMVGLIVAGSDTTSTTLSATVGFLLQEQNAAALRKLVSEVRGSFENEEQITANSTSKLEYLTAVIKEGLRLTPPLTMGIPRVVPQKGDTICDQWVPAGTFVALNHYPAYHSGSNFEKPESFTPERFLPESPFSDNMAIFEPFSVGRHGCLGYRLAWAEMRVTLARLLFAFDMTLAGDGQNFSKWKAFPLWAREPVMVRLSMKTLGE